MFFEGFIVESSLQVFLRRPLCHLFKISFACIWFDEVKIFQEYRIKCSLDSVFKWD